MNERIQELYNQAARYAFNQRVSDPSVAKDLHSAINEKLAALVAAEEREACAKVCEDSIDAIFEFSDEIVKETARNVCINLAKGIRARGNDA